MAGADSGAMGSAPRLRLAYKLAAALLAVAAVMIAFLVAYLGPHARGSFVRRGDALVAQTTALMRRLASEHTQSGRDVLVAVLEHTADARSRTLADLPLSIYGGDVERIREAIGRQDAERSARLRDNVQVLARETQRRADARIEACLGEVAREQIAQTEAFAVELRTGHLVLCGVALLALLGILGLGLLRLVIRPVAQLRHATHRIALGDLEVEVPCRSSDEIGALAADFSAMVGQLRQSRAELTRLNHELEQDVARKTEHLARALEDLKRTHRQLVQAEKMASIGTLAGGMAHEFNNLIGGIRGCANEALHEERDAERRETLAVILRATERGSAITQQLLRFAKRSVDRLEELDASTIAGEALQLIEPEARRRGVQIVRQLSSGVRLMADGDALHQVLVNLLTNALQAMPQGGTVTVTTSAAAEGASIRVADTGVGIVPEEQGRIFEPFFTGRDRERDPAQRGTGLGLSVSYGIVEAHGGHLTVESAPGAGAVFTVWLPRAPKAPGTQDPPPGKAHGDG